MIQDIFPSRMDISFKNMIPTDDSVVLSFTGDGLLARYEEDDMSFPTFKDVGGENVIYIFSVDGKDFFLRFGECSCDGCTRKDMKEVRRLKTKLNRELFEVFTAYHLYTWYEDNRFCGKCGKKTTYDTVERALNCECGNKIYPRINPAVIIGIRNGDRLLITKYRTGYGHSALVAGFTEIGETLEDTVRREVMEEVGLKVKNITYYKSQPWGVVADLLAGFYCDVDGDDEIHMDQGELKYAEWVKREDIELQPNDISLTNEMMKVFKNSK